MIGGILFLKKGLVTYCTILVALWECNHTHCIGLRTNVKCEYYLF
jgi:hypothetical protein